MASVNVTDFHSRTALQLIEPTSSFEAEHLPVEHQATVNALRAITHGLLAVRIELALANDLTWQVRR